MDAGRKARRMNCVAIVTQGGAKASRENAVDRESEWVKGREGEVYRKSVSSRSWIVNMCDHGVPHVIVTSQSETGCKCFISNRCSDDMRHSSL